MGEFFPKPLLTGGLRNEHSIEPYFSVAPRSFLPVYLYPPGVERDSE